jgi:hypothetical protein
MSDRPVASAVLTHTACCVVLLVEAGEPGRLTFGVFAAALFITWVGLFASAVALARRHRWIAVTLPLAASTVALGGTVLLSGGTISPHPAAAPFVAVLWAAVYFWPSIAGSLVGRCAGADAHTRY